MMNLHRAKLTALIACVLTAFTIPLATTAQAATIVSQRPVASSSAGCSYYTADLGYAYYEADKDRSLDWWARNSATSGNPVILEPVSGSSSLDCFHEQGNFSGHPNTIAFQLANSDLCLNIAGNSYSVGAWVILYACVYTTNELFYVGTAGTGDTGLMYESASSGLCIDLDNGYNRGSILEQKTCKFGDIYQAWYTP